MTHVVQQLEDHILSAFTLAYYSAQWDVAEKLLLALEALQSDGLPGSSLARAYTLAAEQNGEWYESIDDPNITKTDGR